MGQGKGGGRLYYRARPRWTVKWTPPGLLFFIGPLRFITVGPMKRASQIKRVSLKRNSRIFNTHAAL